MSASRFVLVLISITMFFTNLSAQHAHATDQTITTTGELKILSWNIYMLPYISRFNSNGKRAEAIGQQLKDSDYQIIVFQEAFSRKCRSILAKQLSANFPYHYGPVNRPFASFRTSSGLWIWSKIPLNMLKSIRFKHATGFDRIAHKGAALFEGQFHGARFQLMATHLQSDNPERIASGQCAEIAQLLKEYYNPEIPQLLCGDFNTEMSDKKNYSRMLKTLDAENGELTGTIQATYDEKNNTLIRKKDGKAEVIDYILTRNTHLIDRIKRSVVEFYHHDIQLNTHLSDHYAMEATLEFVPQPIPDVVLTSNRNTADGVWQHQTH